MNLSSLQEVMLYLYARQKSLKKDLNLGMYSVETTDLLMGRLLEVQALIEMVNMKEPQ